MASRITQIRERLFGIPNNTTQHSPDNGNPDIPEQTKTQSTDLLEYINSSKEISFENAEKIIKKYMSAQEDASHYRLLLTFLAHADKTGDFKDTRRFQNLFTEVLLKIPFEERIPVLNDFLANVLNNRSEGIALYTCLLLDVLIGSVQSEYTIGKKKDDEIEEMAASIFIPLGNLLNDLQNSIFYQEVSKKTLELLEAIPNLKKHAFAPLTVIIENIGIKQKNDEFELHMIEMQVLESTTSLAFREALLLLSNFIEKNTQRAQLIAAEVFMQFQLRIEAEIRNEMPISLDNSKDIQFFLDTATTNMEIDLIKSLITQIIKDNIWMFNPLIINEEFLEKIGINYNFNEFLYGSYLKNIEKILNNNDRRTLLEDFEKIQPNIIEKQILNELLCEINYESSQSYQLFRPMDDYKFFERMSIESINILIESFLKIENTFLTTILLITSKIKPIELSKNLQRYFSFNEVNTYSYAEVLTHHSNWNICPTGEELFGTAIADGAYVLYQPQGFDSPVIIKFNGKLTGITTGPIQLGESLIPAGAFISPIGPVREKLKEAFFNNQRTFTSKPNRQDGPDFFVFMRMVNQTPEIQLAIKKALSNKKPIVNDPNRYYSQRNESFD